MDTNLEFIEAGEARGIIQKHWRQTSDLQMSGAKDDDWDLQ